MRNRPQNYRPRLSSAHKRAQRWEAATPSLFENKHHRPSGVDTPSLAASKPRKPLLIHSFFLVKSFASFGSSAASASSRASSTRGHLGFLVGEPMRKSKRRRSMHGAHVLGEPTHSLRESPHSWDTSDVSSSLVCKCDLRAAPAIEVRSPDGDFAEADRALGGGARVPA